jgi:intein-encoded DNA endonuclease-like protein
MAPRTSLWRMSDDKLDGHLAERILELRASSMSWRQMSQVLYSEHGLTASSETLRQWFDQIEAETGKAAS